MNWRGVLLLKVHCEGLLHPAHDDDAHVFRGGHDGDDPGDRGLRTKTATKVDCGGAPPVEEKGTMVTDLPRPWDHDVLPCPLPARPDPDVPLVSFPIP